MVAVAQPTVLISGAGIAGPSLAFWLTKNGYRVIVVEIADGIRPGGQTVDLRGAGGDVVERMGLMRADAAHALEQHGVAWVASDGSRRAEMPVTAFDGNGLVSKLEILRGDLVDVLYQATKDSAEYRFNTRISALSQDDDGVDVTLADGTKLRADLVVGADGPHSAVRGMVFGPEDEFVKPLGGYNAWFTAPDHVGLDGWYLMYLAPGGLNASMRPTHDPAIAKAGLAFASEPITYDRRDLDAAAPDARRAVRGRRLAVRCAAHRRAGGRRFLLRLIPPGEDAVLASGRVALVGDAGYCASPLSGMGTSLALVGAYLLAGELGPADSFDAQGIQDCNAAVPDHDAALRRQVPGHPQPRRPLRTQLGLRYRDQHRGDEMDAALALPADRVQNLVQGRRFR